MLSATLDSNIYISALNFSGNPRRILNLARTGHIRLDVSNEILDETMGVLRDKFNWADDRLDGLKEHLAGFVNVITPAEKLRVVKDDPDDDKIVECATAAGSDYLVTGDKAILKIGSHGKTRMVTATEFLEIMRRHGLRKAESPEV